MPIVTRRQVREANLAETAQDQQEVVSQSSVTETPSPVIPTITIRTPKKITMKATKPKTTKKKVQKKTGGVQKPKSLGPFSQLFATRPARRPAPKGRTTNAPVPRAIPTPVLRVHPPHMDHDDFRAVTGLLAMQFDRDLSSPVDGAEGQDSAPKGVDNETRQASIALYSLSMWYDAIAKVCREGREATISAPVSRASSPVDRDSSINSVETV